MAKVKVDTASQVPSMSRPASLSPMLSCTAIGENRYEVQCAKLDFAISPGQKFKVKLPGCGHVMTLRWPAQKAEVIQFTADCKQCAHASLSAQRVLALETLVEALTKRICHLEERVGGVCDEPSDGETLGSSSEDSEGDSDGESSDESFIVDDDDSLDRMEKKCSKRSRCKRPHVIVDDDDSLE